MTLLIWRTSFGPSRTPLAEGEYIYYPESSPDPRDHAWFGFKSCSCIRSASFETWSGLGGVIAYAWVATSTLTDHDSLANKMISIRIP